MLEKQIEAYLVKRVKALGGVAYKFTSPSHRGVSDRVVCLPGGVVWFIEVKQASGRLSALQEVFAREMEKLGQHYACLWSKEMVDEWCENEARGRDTLS